MVAPVVVAGAGAAARAAGSGVARGAASAKPPVRSTGGAPGGGRKPPTAAERAAQTQLGRKQSQERLRRELQQQMGSEGGEDELEREHEPKISDMMVILGLIWYGLIDIIGIILLFLGLDDFFVLDVLAWPMQLYLRMKGAPSTYDLIAQLAEMIPYVGALPLRTIFWAITVWVDRNPQGAVAKTTQVARKAISRASRFAPKANTAA